MGKIIEFIVLLLLCPLIGGIITKIKNNLRFRRGPSIFQPYFNLIKYFSKDEVISDKASWIFKATPYIVFASTATALLLIPIVSLDNPLSLAGDFFAVIFLLGLGRFFLALAGIDPATTFGGMGTSREIFIASFVEPVTILAILVIALSAGTTNLNSIVSLLHMNPSTIMAMFSLIMIAIAETSRIPIDNQETHLELTMIHEAMLLEYSGKSLGLLEFSTYLKQLLFFSIIAIVFLPAFSGPVFFLLKILGLSVLVSIVELSLSKMRLFRVVDFLSFAGILSVMAIIALILGV